MYLSMVCAVGIAVPAFAADSPGVGNVHVLDSQVVDLGSHSITYNRVETPALKSRPPPQTLPETAPMAEELEAQRVWDALHDYYSANKPRLTKEFEEAETKRLEQEAWLRAHPPVPKNSVITYFPIRSSQGGQP